MNHHLSLLTLPAKVLVLFALCFASMQQESLFAQAEGDKWESYETASLMNQAINLDPISSIPLLQVVTSRLEAKARLTDKELLLFERSFMLLSGAYLQRYNATADEKDLEACIDIADLFREKKPDSNLLYIVLLNQGDAFMGLKEYEGAIDAYGQLLSPPQIQKLPEKDMLQSLEYLCLAHTLSEEWETGIPWFRKLFNDALSPKRKGQAVISLFRAYNELRTPEKAIRYIPHVSVDLESRYSIFLNTALLQLGQQLAQDGDYYNANLFYFLVYTLGEIREFNVKKVERLERRLRLLRFATDRKSDLAEALELEIEDTNLLLKELEEQEDYASALQFQKSINLDDMDRKFDSFFAFRRLVLEFPDDERAEDFYFSAFLQGARINYHKEAIKIGEAYLERPEFQEHRKNVMAKLSRSYFFERAYDKLVPLCLKFIDAYPQDALGQEIVYYLGNAWVKQAQFPQIIETFSGYIEQYPGAPMLDGCFYWRGMAYIFEQDFEKALPSFEFLNQNYKDSIYFASAQFRASVCLFALEDYEKSRPRFEKWVSENPNHILRGEGEVFLGDIAAIEARVEDSIQHYDTVEQYTQNEGHVVHSYIEGAKLLSANNRHDEAVERLERFIATYREVFDTTLAIFLVGETFETQGKIAQMLERYEDAIQTFGNFPEKTGVDDILNSFAEKYYEYKKKYERNLNFIEGFKNDFEYREALIRNLGELYQLQTDGTGLDEGIINLLMRNPQARETIAPSLVKEKELRAAETEEEKLAIEQKVYPEPDLSALNPFIENYEALLASLPKQSPEERLAVLYEKAKASESWTLASRLHRAGDLLGKDLDPEKRYYLQDFEYASPATLVWMGKRIAELSPGEAMIAFEQLSERYPDSSAVAEALYEIANIQLKGALFDEAIVSYRQLIEKHPISPFCKTAAVKIGDAFLENGDYDAATQAYLDVLQVRDWRGESWAEATFKAGFSFEKKGEFTKAHGFYERTFLSYSRYLKWAGQAYYRDGRVLEELGEIKSAKETYKELLSSKEYKGSTIHEQVRRRYDLIR